VKNIFTSLCRYVVGYRPLQKFIKRSVYSKTVANLRGLSDAQLKDIGIDRGSIAYSARHGRSVDNDV